MRGAIAEPPAICRDRPKGVALHLYIGSIAETDARPPLDVNPSSEEGRHDTYDADEGETPRPPPDAKWGVKQHMLQAVHSQFHLYASQPQVTRFPTGLGRLSFIGKLEVTQNDNTHTASDHWLKTIEYR